MNILVLGGTRYFGVHMVRSLLERGHHVTIATRGQASDSFNANVSRVIVERTSAESLAHAFDGRYYDVVCDNIAYCSLDVKYLLDVIRCGRYVMTSSASVYSDPHPNTAENEFNPLSYPLRWCSRPDFTYDEIKRQAECALFQEYSGVPSAAVRFPYVVGEDDYTRRLYFYVEHCVNNNPMYLDNPDEQIGLIRSTEAGDFIAWVAEQDFTGPVNGCNANTISIREVLRYVEGKTGTRPIINSDGKAGPYNTTPSFWLDTSRAHDLGYRFVDLNDWIFGLLDHYIAKATEQNRAG